MKISPLPACLPACLSVCLPACLLESCGVVVRLVQKQVLKNSCLDEHGRAAAGGRGERVNQQGQSYDMWLAC